jgi:hypothetical protein
VARVARRLERGGVPVPVAATVRRIGRSAAARWPQAAAEIAELERLAERELYAAEPSPHGPAEVRRAWSNLRRALRGSRGT